MHTRELRIDGGMAAVFAATAEKPHAFFLESALPAGGLGRYSFLGFEPMAVFRVAAGGGAEVSWADGRVEKKSGDPLEALRGVAVGSAFTVTFTTALELLHDALLGDNTTL